MNPLFCLMFFLAPAVDGEHVGVTEAQLQQEKAAIAFLDEFWNVHFQSDEGPLSPGVTVNGEEPNRDRPCIMVDVYAHDFSDVWISRDFIDALEKFRFLECLSWDANLKFEDGVKISFRAWPCLTELFIDLSEMPDFLEEDEDAPEDEADQPTGMQPWVLNMFCEEIGKSKSLRNVTIAVQTPEQLAAVLKAENLEWLTLCRCGLWPKEGVANAKKLRKLYLTDMPGTQNGLLPAESLKALAKLPTLESLNIELENDSQLELLLPLKDTIKYLDITGKGITSNAAKTIRQFTKLRSLSVAGTSVDDRFVAETREMPLDCLVLIHTKVTDACVPDLVAWKSLKEISVTPLDGQHGETSMTEKSREPLDKRFGDGMWNGFRFLVWTWDLPDDSSENAGYEGE